MQTVFRLAEDRLILLHEDFLALIYQLSLGRRFLAQILGQIID